MYKVDTRGMSCPQPVLMTKNALENSNSEIEVITDSPVAKGNIKRYATDKGYKVDEREEEDYTLLIIQK